MKDRNTSWWAAVPAVVEFEFRRAMTVPRIAWWCVLALFPVALIGLVLTVPEARRELPREVLQFISFVLIPLLISMLGTFLWTASAISSELEKQSWIYLAVRPGGRIAVLLGKYIVAVAWVLPATLVAGTLCSFLFWASGSTVSQDGLVLRTWFTLVRLCCLAVPTYAAVYLLLGTIFTKRAMVISVAYTLIFELVVSMVPALINKLTIQYRLRALGIDWADIDLSQAGSAPTADLFGDSPAWLHVCVLVGLSTGLVLAATWLVRKREYLITVSADVS